VCQEYLAVAESLREVNPVLYLFRDRQSRHLPSSSNCPSLGIDPNRKAGVLRVVRLRVAEKSRNSDNLVKKNMERANVRLSKEFETVTSALVIVHISDTHNKDYDHKIPPGDILIHSGDFTHRGKPEEVQKFRSFLSRQPHRYKIVVCGNHEKGLDSLEYSELMQLLGEDVIILQDSAVTINGINFWGTAWNNSSHAWGVSDTVLETKWNLIPSDTDVLITHIPPYGILDLAWQPSHISDQICSHCRKSHPRYNHWGDRSLAQFVDSRQIPLHLFGHVHDEVGIIKIGETTYSNAAMDIAKVVNVIKLFASVPPATPDWPLSKIIRRLEGIHSGQRKPRAVLLTTGALNPIHKGHIQNMELAKSSIESQGFEVLGGFLSPSSDAYVTGKMKSQHRQQLATAQVSRRDVPPVETFYSSAAHRLKMTQLACSESDWLSHSSWESNQPYFADFDEVLSNLEDVLRTNGIFENADDTVVYVCGSDHFLKCSLQRGVRTSRGTRPVVVCRRQEESEELLRNQSQSSIVTIVPSSDSSFPLIEHAEELNDLSSTLIRSLLLRITPETISSLSTLLPPLVCEYLLTGEGRLLYREEESL
jgi:Icc-related predicted phosphoesterase/nicotinic acid mononucleotide adenylyltransferase